MEALESYDASIKLNPNLVMAWNGRGNIFCHLLRYDEAFAAYERALVLNPGLAEAWVGRGNIFNHLKCYDEAFAAYERALVLNPDLAEAWLGRGSIFLELKRYDEAFGAYDKALALKPDLEGAEGYRLHTKMHLCNWRNFDAECAHLISAVSNGNANTSPFALIGISSSSEEQLQCAKLWVANRYPASDRALWQGERQDHDRIRVAYVSSDLRDHPVAHLTAGLFEHHDKSRFEVTAISLGPEQDSDFCRRIRASFERFVDIPLQSDRNIADLIRQLEIDIAVDLNGFTQNGRTDVFAQRPAPIQVSYLGYSGTMGADYYDYIIADRTVIPEEHFDFYSEKAVWLPDSFLVNDAARPIVERTPTRGELHLPETGFVFCCFNQSYKLNPTIFDVWMRLLKAVDGSVLWLREYNETALHNLRLEAERRGVAPERLVFAPPVPLIAEHLARHRQADLFLDTLPYNGHTTAADALWAGLPVVTCLGSAFAGRVAASLLQAVGLSELITASLEDYEALALKLARDPVLLASLKAKLARNRGTYPLFDTERFTRNLEAAYTTMWRRYQNAEPPASFAVKAGG